MVSVKQTRRSHGGWAPHGLRRWCAGAAFLFLALVVARRAEAYPQFVFSSGTSRCVQCHYSPAGGGLLTSWGRDESSDTISMKGGNGAFLHGAVETPKWLALGGDFMGAALVSSTKDASSPEFAVFPMQADLYAHVAFGETGVSAYVSGGLRGAVRGDNNDVTTHQQGLISAEHYLMWKPSATGPYARVGRFFAPYGLRLAEHLYYVRRYMGFNLFEETYNASGGYLEDNWEAHLTVFTRPPKGFPDWLQAGGSSFAGSGVAAYGEYRFNSMASVGAQARGGTNDEKNFYQGGLDGRLWLDAAHLLISGEADLARSQLKTSKASWSTFAAYLGATLFPTKGVMVTVAGERYQEDLHVAAARDAADLQVSFYPMSHLEIMGLGRYQYAGSNTPGAKLGMLMIHYYP